MKRFLRIFSRRQGKTRGGIVPSPPADEWQVGDLAECVFDGPWCPGGVAIAPKDFGPQRGEVRIVRTISPSPLANYPGPMLGFDRWKPNEFYHRTFRKITPRADKAERADAAFRDRLKTRAHPEPVEGSPAPELENA